MFGFALRENTKVPELDKPSLYPPIPENMPRLGNRFTRWIGSMLMRAFGWRLVGEFPNEKQLVIAGAPHTSNWDFVFAMLAMVGAGVRFSFLMKQEAFFWPLRGLFMSLGGVPIDRSASKDIVPQLVNWYRTHEKVWVAITPEGTRSDVKKLKTGFLRLAKDAGVPVLLVSWDYERKLVVIDKLWPTTGDVEKDAEDIHNYITKKFRGKNSR